MNRRIFAPAVLTCCLALAASAASAASDTDKAFVAKVSQGGAYEVAASNFAVQHATMPDVKDQAIAEVHDHQLVGAGLKRISSASGITITPELNQEFTERLAKLKSAVGPGFDVAYIEDMKSIHDKDEKLFAQEAIDGSDAFKTFAHQTDSSSNATSAHSTEPISSVKPLGASVAPRFPAHALWFAEPLLLTTLMLTLLGPSAAPSGQPTPQT